jgi:uncharacterized membrane protein
MRNHRDLIAASATAVLCAAIALVVPLEGLQIVAAVPLSLVLPGYAITVAVFGQRPLPPPYLLLLSVALSLAALATGTLLLNYVGGLRAASWAVLLVAVVLGGCFIAGWHRRVQAGTRLPRLQLGIRRADGALLVGAFLAALVALALAWTPLPVKNAVGYTELWMLPNEGPKAPGVRVGVVSQSQHRTAYRLELRIEGQDRPVSTQLVLDPGQRRVLEVPVSRPTPNDFVRVSASLFRRDRPGTVYRRATGWVRGDEAAQ